MLFGFALGFALYHLVKFAIGINNPKSKLLADLKNLAQELRNEKSVYVPLSDENLKSISASIVSLPVIRQNLLRSGGSLLTVFEEPAIDYYLQKTPIEKVSLMAIRGDQFEAQFYQKENGADIYQNGLLLGHITDDYRLYNTGQQAIAEITAGDGMYHSLMYQGQEVAKILKNHYFHVKVNDRVLSEINTDLLKQNESVKSFLFYYLVSELA